MNKVGGEEFLQMILPSDSNFDVFPENRSGDFSVQLEKSYTFKNPVKCAVTDLILPKLVPFFKETSVIFVKFVEHFSDTSKAWEISKNTLLSLKIPGKFIYDFREYVNDIFKELNSVDFQAKLQQSIEKEFGNLEILNKSKQEYQFNSNQISIEPLILINSSGDGLIKIFPVFKEPLFQVLNLSTKFFIPDVINDFETLPSDSFIKMINDTTSSEQWEYTFFSMQIWSVPVFNNISQKYFENIIDFYIVCDIIIDSYVNNKKYSYLRYCHCDSFGKLLMSFEPLIFYPVVQNEISRINYKLLDKNFNEIIFQKGTTIVFLNFEQING